MTLALGRSPRLAVLLGAVHAGAGFSVWVTPLPLWLRAALAALLAANAYVHVNRHALRRGARAVHAVALRNGSCLVRRGVGRAWYVCELTAAHVHPRFTLLRLRERGAKRAHDVVIGADAVDPLAFRALRAALRTREG